MGALIHKDQNKKLLTKETKINDEFNSPNTEKWIHEYEIDTYPEGNTSNWNSQLTTENVERFINIIIMLFSKAN